MKKIFLLIIISILTLFLGLFIGDRLVSYLSEGKIFSSLKDLPHKKAGLLLGTSKYVVNGQKNRYYLYRVEAAAELFKDGKIDAVIISGDNAAKRYNEPKSMLKDLIALGVPKKYITLDYAGFRTLDSVIRAKEIFDLDDFIIISQQFHIERALFIANTKGIKAIGYATKDIEGRSGLKVRLREVFARVKAYLDLYILNTQPRFYGDKVNVTYLEQVN